MSREHRCPACASARLRVFFQWLGVPVHSMLLLSDRKEAMEQPRGDIELAYCQDCGFITNLAFNPALMRYSTSYESSQAFSPCFNAYAQELAQALVTRHGLFNKDLVEIGCGRGDFLLLLCKLGGNRGVGIDPAVDVGQAAGTHGAKVTFIQDVYSDKYAGYRADLLLCRHTLEHIRDVGLFLDTVGRALGQSRHTVLFFELPDVARILREVAFWDIYYEHCSYFCAGSLAHLFTSRGFDVTDLRLAFDGQYLLLEAVPGRGLGKEEWSPQRYLPVLEQDIAHFAGGFQQSVSCWRERLGRMAGRGQRCVVWGGGSKGVAFLNALGVRDEVEYVVDINPLKQNKYVAGTGHPIVGPDYLPQHRPDVILVMNPIYREEVRELARGKGIEAEVLTP